MGIAVSCDLCVCDEQKYSEGADVFFAYSDLPYIGFMLLVLPCAANE